MRAGTYWVRRLHFWLTVRSWLRATKPNVSLFAWLAIARRTREEKPLHRVIAALSARGLSPRLIRLGADHLAEAPLPALAFQLSGDAVVVTAADADSVVLRGLFGAKIARTREGFDRAFSGVMLIAARDADGAAIINPTVNCL